MKLFAVKLLVIASTSSGCTLDGEQVASGRVECDSLWECRDSEILNCDEVVCSDSSACEGATISGSTTVTCSKLSACAEATITGVVNGGSVSCSGTWACQDAKLEPVEGGSITINCGDNSCDDANINGGLEGRVVCDGCKDAEVWGREITCNLPFSCDSASILDVPDGQTVICGENGSCWRATIAAAPGASITVECSGENGCDDSSLNAGPQGTLDCSGRSSCSGATMRGRTFNCPNAASCLSASMLEVPDGQTIRCPQEISCSGSAITVQPGASISVICSGESSCSFGEIDSGRDGSVDCSGEHSCYISTVQGARVDCSNVSSCSSAVVTGIGQGETVVCPESRSCTRSFISAADSASISVLCSGSDACHEATILAGPEGFVDCSVGGEACHAEFQATVFAPIRIFAKCLDCRNNGCSNPFGKCSFTDSSGATSACEDNVQNGDCSSRPSSPESADDSDSSDDGGGTCFSANNVVRVQGKGEIAIEDLQIGDLVESKRGQYSRVYSHGHKDGNSTADYIQVFVENRKTPLELTASHILYVNGKLVPASQVKVGDELSDNQIVVKLKGVRRQGLYAPLTESGSIVVSGIRASCYIVVLSEIPPAVQVLISHAVLVPVRFVCGIDFDFCRNETYTHGYATYVLFWLELGKTLAALDFQAVAVIAASPLWVAALLLEAAVHNSFLIVCLVVGYYGLSATKAKARA